MLEHSRSALQVAALERDIMAADAAGWLLHMQVQRVDNALLLVLGVEGSLSGSEVEFAELDRTEGKRSRHFPRESLGEVSGLI